MYKDKKLLFMNLHMVLCFRKSAMSFFAAYDALCEEGTATTVCKALDEVADISIPGKVIFRLRIHHLLNVG